MAVEHDLDAGEAPSDMKEDMVDADLGQPEACKLAIANVYWMVEYIQAVDSAWMDLGETPVGPRDEEGVERFIGVIKERHERTGGVTRRWFNLEAKDQETYTPYVRLMLRAWEGHALPELVIGDEVLIERHTSLARCDLPNEDGELTTLLFTTIKNANTGDLIHAEGDALLLPSGSIQLPTIAPISAQRWSWRHARGCANSTTTPFTFVSIETAGGPSITPGETTIEGLDLFTFYLSGHLDPEPGTCGLWQFYATPRSP